MTDQDKKNGTGQEIQEKKAAPKAETASDSAGTDISFIKEKVKERPINKRKLLKRTMITASMAVIFGLIACFTFLVLVPVFSNWLYPEEEPEPVQLQEESENEEMLPEDMVLETESEGKPRRPYRPPWWNGWNWTFPITRRFTAIFIKWCRRCPNLW